MGSCREATRLFEREVDDFLGLEELLFVEVGDVPRANFLLEGGEFFGEVAAFEVEDAVAEGVVVAVGDFAAHPASELAEVGHGTRDDEVVVAFDLLGAYLLGTHVLELEAFGNILHHLDFLAYRVDEVEVGVGEHDGEGYAGEAAPGAHVEDVGHGLEGLHLGDGETVEDVVLVEVVHVFAGDDVDLGVPVLV